MRRNVNGRVGTGFLALGVSVGLAACVPGSDGGHAPGRSDVAAATTATTRTTQALALQSAFPGARTDGVPGGLSRIFGASLATGATPADAADRFRQGYASAAGVGPNDLVPQDLQRTGAAASASPTGIGLMYDATTGQPKFWLFRYSQTTNGVPVHRGGLLALVRNDGGNAVVCGDPLHRRHRPQRKVSTGGRGRNR
jgi:hypothetical protein